MAVGRDCAVKESFLKASELLAADAIKRISKEKTSGVGRDQAVLWEHRQAARSLACDR